MKIFLVYFIHLDLNVQSDKVRCSLYSWSAQEVSRTVAFSGRLGFL